MPSKYRRTPCSGFNAGTLLVAPIKMYLRCTTKYKRTPCSVTNAGTAATLLVVPIKMYVRCTTADDEQTRQDSHQAVARRKSENSRLKFKSRY